MYDQLAGSTIVPPVRLYQNAAYEIRNRASPMVYVGSTCHPGARASAHRSNLGRGKHENKNLQALYDESPDIYFVFYEVATRDCAYELEKMLINHFLARGELLNICLDPVNDTLTPELYAAMRKGNIAYTAEVSVPVTIDGIEYLSLSDAGRHFNISHSAVQKRIESPKKKYAGWHYTGKPKISSTHNGARNAVIVNVEGKEYTLSEYRRHTGISYKTLQWRKRLGIQDHELHLPVQRKPNGAEMLVVKP